MNAMPNSHQSLDNLPPDLVQLLAARQSLWEKIDSWELDRQRLEKLRISVPSGTAANLSPFVQDNQPPDELRQAVQRLETTLHQVARCEDEIKSMEKEIDEVNHQAMTMMFVIGVGGFIALVIVIWMLGAIFG